MTEQTEAPKAGATIIPVTPFQQNCMLLWCETTKKAVVVDPGGDVLDILNAIKQAGVKVEHIWLTHGHVDHVGGADAQGDDDPFRTRGRAADEPSDRPAGSRSERRMRFIRRRC